VLSRRNIFHASWYIGGPLTFRNLCICILDPFGQVVKPVLRSKCTITNTVPVKFGYLGQVRLLEVRFPPWDPRPGARTPSYLPRPGPLLSYATGFVAPCLTACLNSAPKQTQQHPYPAKNRIWLPQVLDAFTCCPSAPTAPTDNDVRREWWVMSDEWWDVHKNIMICVLCWWKYST